MVLLPINVINLITKFAAEDDKLWYPFFSQDTHKLTWKVNKCCRKYIEKSHIILHNKLYSRILKGMIILHNMKTGEIKSANYNAIMFLKYIDNTYKLYIEIDNKKENKYIYRTMLNFDGIDQGGSLNSFGYLYLNEINYAIISDGLYYHNNNTLTLTFEPYI